MVCRNSCYDDGLQQIIPNLMVCCKSNKNGWFAANHTKMDVLQQTIICVNYYKEWIAESLVTIDGLPQIIPSLMICCKSYKKG
jgi:hypothetical protein